MAEILMEILINLVPRKYRSIGHLLIGLGGCIIIFSIFFNFFNIFQFFQYFSIFSIIFNNLGQSCLIIGLSGIYLSKTKNFRSVRKSEEKEGIEQKSLNGINSKFLQKFVYIFYVITIVGVVFSFYFLYSMMLLTGDLLLIGGLLILYFKKKKENRYRLENLPIRYRFTWYWKCKNCGNKFRSKIMQCPACKGENLKRLGV